MIQLNNTSDVKTFTRYANLHRGNITLYSGRFIIDGKSIMGVFSLDLTKPIKMEIEGAMSLDVKCGIDKYVIVQGG